MSIPISYSRTPPFVLLATSALLACGPERSPVEPRLDPAAIMLDDAELSFELMEGDEAPPPGEITVSNAGEQPLTGLDVTAEYDGPVADWLELELLSTSAPSTLRVGLHSEGLREGEHRATLLVTADGVPNSPQSVTVTALVMPRPDPASVRLSTKTVEVEMEEAGAHPDTVRIDVTNGGDLPLGPLTVDVVYDDPDQDPWLSAGLEGLDVPSVLKLAALGSSLGLGTWGADVVVAAPEDVDTVRVELNVTPAPALLRLEAESHLFTIAAGAPNPPVEEIDIFNDAPGSLVGLEATARYAASEPEGWLSSAVYDSERGTWLSLGLLAGALPEGTWTAWVAVDAQNATNGPVELEVTVEVGPPSGFLNISTGNIYLESEYGAGDPEPLDFDVVNMSVGTLVNISAEVVPRAGSEGDWVSVALASSTAPTVLTLSFDLDGLPARSYYADLTLHADGASNSPVERRITLVITGGEPDLTVLAPPTDSAVVVAGESVELPALTFANIGSARSNGFRVGYYLSSDPEISASDLYLTGASYSWLAATEEVVQPYGPSLEIPAGTAPGVYYLGALIDDEDATAESDEDNNAYVRRVHVIGG